MFGKPYDFVGTKTFGSVAGYKAYANSFIYTVNIPGCTMPGRVFVGQRKEGFAVNLGPVFDLVNFVPVEGDSAPGAGDGGGLPGRHHAEARQQPGGRRQRHHHRARSAQELPGRARATASSAAGPALPCARPVC